MKKAVNHRNTAFFIFNDLDQIVDKNEARLFKSSNSFISDDSDSKIRFDFLPAVTVSNID